MLLNAVSVGDVYTSVTEILTMIWGVFGSCIQTITGNPILFASVLLGLGSSVIFGAIRLVKKMGIHGITAGRRRRR